MEVVIGAVVSAVALVLVALIGRGMFDRRMKQTIGYSNGRGSIVQMNEQQLDMIEGLQKSVLSVEQHRLEAEQKMRELTNSVGSVNLNLQQIARFQNLISGVRMDFEARFDDIGNILADIEQRLLDLEQRQQKFEATRFRVPHLPSRTIEKPVNEKG
jgi:hypothetical protein